MDNESRQVCYTINNELTNDVISASICDEEIRFGLPLTTITVNHNFIELPLQDIPDIIASLQSLLRETSSFTDKEQFERNKIVLKKTTTEKWMQMFEHYHEINRKKR